MFRSTASVSIVLFSLVSGGGGGCGRGSCCFLHISPSSSSPSCFIPSSPLFYPSVCDPHVLTATRSRRSQTVRTTNKPPALSCSASQRLPQTINLNVGQLQEDLYLMMMMWGVGGCGGPGEGIIFVLLLCLFHGPKALRCFDGNITSAIKCVTFVPVDTKTTFLRNRQKSSRNQLFSVRRSNTNIIINCIMLIFSLWKAEAPGDVSCDRTAAFLLVFLCDVT